MLKKLALAIASTPALTSLAIAHADPGAHGAVMAQVPHVHFGSNHAIALGIVGVFVAGLIAAIIVKGSATKSPRTLR